MTDKPKMPAPKSPAAPKPTVSKPAPKPQPAKPKANPEAAALKATLADLETRHAEACARKSGIRNRYANQIAACKKQLAQLEQR